MTAETLNTDDLLRHLGGCGRFQLAVVTFASLTYISGGYSMISMTFGMHSPGWRCLDNGTHFTSTKTDSNNRSMLFNGLNNDSLNKSNTEKSTSPGVRSSYNSQLFLHTENQTIQQDFTDTCAGWDSCQNVQFNPEESTIVSEWGLICGDSWKASAITSIQMAGMTTGHFISGYLGDAHGRKLALSGCVFIHAALSFVSIASVTWEMFAVVEFLIGVACGVVFCIANVYMTEFVTPKWRAIIPSIPMWVIGCSMFSMCALAFKDWRHLKIFGGVFTGLLLIPGYLLPESVRWLLINEKKRKCHHAVSQMVKINKANASTENLLQRVNVGKDPHENNGTNIFACIRLFHKPFGRYTIVLSAALFFSNMIYFASSFGVSSLPGDIYLNNIIIYSTELPGNVIAWFAPNAFGRKPMGALSCVVQGVFLFVFLAFDYFTIGSVRKIGMLVFIIMARFNCDMAWFLVVTCTGELYPTTIRALATGFMMFVAGVAASISPYTITNSDVMYTSFLAMAVMSLVSGALFLLIPETLGKDLTDDLTTKSPTDRDLDSESLFDHTKKEENKFDIKTQGVVSA